MRRGLLAGLVCLLGWSCGPAWVCPSVGEIATISPGQEVEVWARGQVYYLQGLRLEGDSLSGVPLTENLRCDSCRIRLSRAELESLRFRNTDGDRGAVIGAAFVIVLTILFFRGMAAGIAD